MKFVKLQWIRIGKKIGTNIVIGLCLMGAHSSYALTLDYHGEVMAGTGALGSLVPTGSTLSGTFEFDFSGSPASWSDTQNILSLTLSLFNPETGINLFCFPFNTNCPVFGGTPVPVVDVDSLIVNEGAGGLPLIEFVDLVAFSPILQINMFITLDIANEVFAIDANFLGSVSGSGSFGQVPVPAAMWLLASALVLLPRRWMKNVNDPSGV